MNSYDNLIMRLEDTSNCGIDLAGEAAQAIRSLSAENKRLDEVVVGMKEIILSNAPEAMPAVAVLIGESHRDNRGKKE